MARATKAPEGETSTKQQVLYIAFELSKKSWKLRFSDGVRISEHDIAGGDRAALFECASRVIEKFDLTNPRILSCYEAGLDGFWLHRLLESKGVENLVVDPASIQVDRRAKRLKTDRSDAEKLLRMLMRHHAGEPKVWHTLRVPTAEAEDARIPHRRLDRLIQDRTRIANRITGLLQGQGIVVKVGPRMMKADFAQFLAEARTGDGRPLAANLRDCLARARQSWLEAHAEIGRIRREQALRVKQARGRTELMVKRLASLCGIGTASAWVLVHEMLGWRDFNNRKQVAACAGLAPVHFASGAMARDLGISKAGNAMVRTLMVELSWLWLRYQPGSALTKWYEGRMSGSSAGWAKKKAITALARKLLVALWRFAVHGVLPEGAAYKRGQGFVEYAEAA